MKNEVRLYVGESLGKYGFPHGHPFGPTATAPGRRPQARADHPIGVFRPVAVLGLIAFTGEITSSYSATIALCITVGVK